MDIADPCQKCGEHHSGRIGRHVRLYGPSLQQRISRAQTITELRDLVRAILESVEAHNVSAGTKRKLERRVAAKLAEFKEQRIIRPDTRLVVPGIVRP